VEAREIRQLGWEIDVISPRVRREGKYRLVRPLCSYDGLTKFRGDLWSIVIGSKAEIGKSSDGSRICDMAPLMKLCKKAGGASCFFRERLTPKYLLAESQFGPEIALVYHSHLSLPRLHNILTDSSQNELKHGRVSSRSPMPQRHHSRENLVESLIFRYRAISIYER